MYYIRRLSVYSDSREPAPYLSDDGADSVFHGLKVLRKVGGRVDPDDKIT